MKCTKTWCAVRHLACEKFKKDDPMYACHRKDRSPFPTPLPSSNKTGEEK